MEIASSPVTVTLSLNKPYSMDLNGDGINDVSIKLESMINSKASITLSEITKPVVTNGQGNSAGGNQGGLAGGKWGPIWIYILVLAIVVIVFVIVVITSSRNRKSKTKRK